MSVTSIGVLRLYQSSIGKKVIMAVTGLIGIGFVIFHMYGNLKAFQFFGGGAAYFNEYSEGLRTLGEPIFGPTHLLWIGRLGLLAAVVLHVWAAWSLYRESQRARPSHYTEHKKLRATIASLYMRVGGVILLIFIIFHIMHFTWGVPVIHPDFSQTDVYRNLVVGFQSYGFLPAIFYLIALVFLGLHLYHGVWSMFQTLGLNNKTYTKPLQTLALVVAIIVAIGFAIVPLAVIFGILA